MSIAGVSDISSTESLAYRKSVRGVREDSVSGTFFHIFGSADSIDLDVLVFVEILPDLEVSKTLVTKIAPSIQIHYEDAKKLNINFGILRDGVIVETLKGIPDETNNAVLATYGFHTQQHPLAIARAVPRDLDAKYQRAARMLLSLYSRTPHREAVKQALRGDIRAKCAMLKQLDFSVPVDFGKNGVPEDVYKSIAFQLGQTLALAEGVELYTKEDLISYFPEFGFALRRQPLTPECRQALENTKQRFLSNCRSIE